MHNLVISVVMGRATCNSNLDSNSSLEKNILKFESTQRNLDQCEVEAKLAYIIEIIFFSKVSFEDGFLAQR